MSSHISKQNACEHAKLLAFKFMRKQDTKQWLWEISSIAPDLIDPQKKGRKIATHWIAAVTYSTEDDDILDGPAILRIDIVSGDVAFV